MHCTANGWAARLSLGPTFDSDRRTGKEPKLADGVRSKGSTKGFVARSWGLLRKSPEHGRSKLESGPCAALVLEAIPGIARPRFSPPRP